MTIYMKIFAAGCLFVCLVAVGAFAQQTTDSGSTSLGDVARGLKAQKPKEAKPVKVFTNDNLSPPAATASSPASADSGTKNPPPAAPDNTGKSAQGHDEKYYRERLSHLQSQLDTHKRELDVLQKKLNENDMQFYSNPQDSLMQQYTRGDINKRTAAVDAKKREIADDEKAIEDLRDQLRREGGDPGWLR
jgi:hypothetical protein